MTDRQNSVTERERLLRLIAAAASERRPLQEALREDDSAAGRAIADVLDRGMPLSDAFAAQWPGRAWGLVADGPIPLEGRVLLLAEEERARHDLWGLFLQSLLYPMTVCIASVVLALNLPTGLEQLNWLWLLLGLGAMAVLSLVIPLVSLGKIGPRPWIMAWRWHARRSELFEQLAAAAKWRADEKTLSDLFGQEILALTPWMVGEGAEERCRLQARHHRDGARKSLRGMLMAMVLGFHLLAGAGYLAVVQPAASQFLSGIQEAFDID